MASKERTYFLLALLLGSAVLAFFVFRPFLTTFALAAVFAVVLHPVQERLLRRLKGRAGIASLLTLLIGCFFVLIPLTLVGTLLLDQSRTAYGSFISGSFTAQKIVVAIGSWLEPHVPGAGAYAQTVSLEINSYLGQGLQWFIGRAGAAFTGALSFVLHLIIFLMSLYYLLRDGDSLEKLLIRKSPLVDEEGAAIFKQLSLTVSSVVKGSLVIACVQGMLAGIGYFLFGVPNAVLWGLSTAVSALIPGVGTSLILVPTVIYLFITGNVTGGIGLALWGMFLVGLIDNFLAPRLMSRGAQLHPLVILLSILGGVALYGPAGIFLGPLTASFLYAVYTVYAKQTLAT